MKIFFLLNWDSILQILGFTALTALGDKTAGADHSLECSELYLCLFVIISTRMTVLACNLIARIRLLVPCGASPSNFIHVSPNMLTIPSPHSLVDMDAFQKSLLP